MSQNALAGCIYAIGIEGSPYIKIGSTRQTVEQRLVGLQTGQPATMHVIATVAVDGDLRQIERLVHTLLAKERQRGEWFETSMDEARLTDLVREANQAICDKDVARTPQVSPARSESCTEKALLDKEFDGLMEALLWISRLDGTELAAYQESYPVRRRMMDRCDCLLQMSSALAARKEAR